MRTTSGITKMAMVVGLIAISLFGIGLPAMAADGPTPPQLSDPVGGDVAPHGGFGVGTDYCLQCHQVHYNRASLDAPGEYALMAESSVTATCATCHGFEGNVPTGPEDPGFGGSIGTASTRAVYTEATEIHVIGAGFGTVGRNAGWDFYTWAGTGLDPNTRGPEGPSNTPGSAGVASYYNGGLYCGSCHSPHGEFGQLINAKWAVTSADQNNSGGTDPITAVPWQDDTRIWWEDPTPNTLPGVDPNLDPNNPWKQVYLHFNGTAWTVCEGTGGSGDCEYAQVLDAEGQLVSLYGYKLLTTSPNHQYPVRNASGQYLQNDGVTYGSTPPVGLYSDAPFAGGTLARNAGSPNFLTENVVGTVDTNQVDPGDTVIDVAMPSATATPPTAPFKIRLDDEIMMVTSTTNVGPGFYTFTVTRAVEPVEPEVACRPWGPVYSNTTTGAVQFDACPQGTHPANTEILLVPTLLVNETSTLSVAPTNGGANPTPPPNYTSGNSGGLKPLASYTSSQRVGVPFHIKVTVSGTTEMMVVLWRTRIGSSGSQYLYTVGRAVDGTPSISAGNGSTFYVQSGVSRNSIRSWGVDLYSGDMSSFCGSCHSGPVDVQFGGQYHSHPTGCAECHGSSTFAGNDFPHSSANDFMLMALPDGLCINCHVAGTLP